MPAAVFRIDPYCMARFGGAFFGTALVLAVYFFLREGCRDRRAALAGAFGVASFPGLMLLHKTGVGAFANQAGLLMLPLILAGNLLIVRGERRTLGLAVGVFATLGMLLTVPMMGLHVVMVLLLFGLFHGWSHRPVLPKWAIRLLYVLVPIVGLAGAYLLRTGSRVLAMTALVLTTADEAAASHI